MNWKKTVEIKLQYFEDENSCSDFYISVKNFNFAKFEINEILEM